MFENFGKRLSQVSVAAILITTLLAIANQIDAGEPYWLAHRGFVRYIVSQATTKIEARQIQTQIQLAEQNLATIENEIANKQVLLEQNKDAAEDLKNVIREQLRTLTRNLQFTKNTLDDLRREQSGRRP